VDFVANALLGRQQPLNGVDPRKGLPVHRLIRGGIADAVESRPAAPAARPSAERAPAVLTASEGEPLRITVINGDLTFEPDPLMLGHYHATRLTGTEKIMNRLIGGAMERSLDMGVYPVAVGTHQIFINSRPNLERGSFMPRPAAVIIVGLGEEGKLRSTDLVQTIRQAVIAWAQRLAETRKQTHGFSLAATLLGSGGHRCDRGRRRPAHCTGCV
jgi:hypothetical protein